MIITASEVQSILNISGQEERLETLIPLAESYAFDYTHNYFHTAFAITVIGDFQNNKLTIEYGYDFDDTEYYDNYSNLQAGLFIHILNSKFNDAIYKINGVEGNILTLNSSLTIELKSKFVLRACKITEGFKISLANYIGALLNNNSTSDKGSERIGDYSYTKKSARDLLKEFFQPYLILKVT
jgi:hypothetical protein